MQAVCKKCNRKGFPKCMGECEKLSNFQKSLINRIFSSRDDSYDTYRINVSKDIKFSYLQ